MAGDWVKLHRKIIDSDLMHDHWLLALWVWCLAKANFRVRHGLKPGQFVTGRLIGSEELKVSPSKFYRGLQKLAEQGRISLESDNKKTVVTILKWETYQDDDEPKRTTSEQPANNQRTTSEQPADTIEEGKKERREECFNPPTPQTETRQLGSPWPSMDELLRGEGESEKPKPIPVSILELEIPPELETPEFRAAWSEWLQHCRDRSGTGRLSKASLTEQLRLLTPFGPWIGTLSIRSTMAVPTWTKLDPERTERDWRIWISETLEKITIQQFGKARTLDAWWRGHAPAQLRGDPGRLLAQCSAAQAISEAGRAATGPAVLKLFLEILSDHDPWSRIEQHARENAVANLGKIKQHELAT